jgi:hypothetical protein
MSLASIPTVELSRELERRAQAVVSLEKKRDILLRELAGIEQRLLGTGIGWASKPSVRNGMPLADALARSISLREQVSPGEASKRVIASGHLTNAKHFDMMVSNTLAKDPRFQRVSRGQYQRVS